VKQTPQAPKSSKSARKRPVKAQGRIRYLFRLFVSGNTGRASAAVSQIKSLCEEHFSKNYTLEIVDVFQQPALAARDKVIAAPTLLRISPKPVLKVSGNFDDISVVLKKLGVR
jgi:circadian clock protein KaiB